MCNKIELDDLTLTIPEFESPVVLEPNPEVLLLLLLLLPNIPPEVELELKLDPDVEPKTGGSIQLLAETALAKSTCLFPQMLKTPKLQPVI